VVPRLLLRSLAARRARVILALMAVALGVAVSTALTTLALQVGDDLARTLRAAGPNFVVLPAGARLPVDVGGADFEPARAGLALPESSFAEIKRCFWKNAFLDAAPELSVTASIGRSAVPLTGTWFVHDAPADGGAWRTGLPSLRPHWKLAGRWPREGATELVVSRELQSPLGAVVGRTLAVTYQGRAQSWTVTGILDQGGREKPGAWAPLAAVQRLARREGQIDRVWLSALIKPPTRKAVPDPAKDPAGYERWSCTPYPANIAKDLAQRLPAAEVLPMTEVVAGEGMVVERLNVLMLLLALAALVASTLGLLSTTTAAVVERSVELGLLRSLGATSRQIGVLLLGETMLVSLAGGLLGWGLGALGAAAIRGQTFGTASASPPLLLPLALFLSLVVAVAGTLGPLKMALRVDPAQVLRG
jgi:putative ABC transport system permease protein